jgi:hypothetical protein
MRNEIEVLRIIAMPRDEKGGITVLRSNWPVSTENSMMVRPGSR